MEDDAVLLVASTAPDEATARRIAQALVERRLAACVNVGAPVWSVYRWQGAIEQAQEFPLWIKTTAARRQALMQALAELHPYDVPEALALPAVDGLPAYLEWVRQEVKE
ncbi:divalent-cation tolerance protein CutA [Pigmentiphaga soli]|uniref:Divalent-cation tolerance protein CutA n=2 Tax=Pigmentiphaga soli TaxID=1007095 RepID=A0ABP8HBC9_9BURK